MFSLSWLDSALGVLLRAVWLLLPAGVANMAPVFAAILIPSWDTPVDFGCSFRGTRFFGSHKTWRGLIAGLIAGSVTFIIQRVTYEHVALVQHYSYFEYDTTSWMMGAWMGAGALTGDLIKSFVKRGLRVPPGQPCFPFDQLDWLIGTVLFTFPFIRFTSGVVAEIILVGFFLHLIANLIGYALGLKRSWI
jgi:CDP-2,3-bis-(O-geranylgeranyl)-sn-glycerol synthase